MLLLPEGSEGSDAIELIFHVPDCATASELLGLIATTSAGSVVVAGVLADLIATLVVPLLIRVN